jgi:hypothetical protein
MIIKFGFDMLHLSESQKEMVNEVKILRQN